MYQQYQQSQRSVPHSPADRDTPSTALVTDRVDLANVRGCFRSPSMPMENNDASPASLSPVHWTDGDDLRQNAKAFAPVRLPSLSESSFSSVTLPPMGVRDATDAAADDAAADDAAADDALASSSPNRPHPTPTSDDGCQSKSSSSAATKTGNRRSSSNFGTRTPRRHSSGAESDTEEGTDLDEQMARFVPMQAARAHWMQLHKQGMQLSVLQRMFLRLLQRHAPLRALWPFGRCFDAGKENIDDELLTSAVFQHFCAAYQSALTMVMDTLDDEPSLCRMLQELGANHFFYDATETHFKMMREEFLLALDECVRGTSEELNDELEQDWDQLWAKMENNLTFGLAVQRHNYLAHCVTSKEMAIVRTQWQTLLEAKCRMDALGAAIREHGIQTFSDASNRIGREIWPREQLGQQFTVAVNDLLWAMAQAIALWEPGTGFLRLCAEIDARCGGAFEVIRMTSAALLRKAFIEGLSAELFAVLDENEATAATTLHSWTKVYRVAEQAIIADGMDNERRGKH